MDMLRTGLQFGQMAGAATNPYMAALSLAGGLMKPQQDSPQQPQMGKGGGLDLDSLLQRALSGLGGGQPQQQAGTESIQAPNPSPMLNTSFQYAPPSPLNPLPPLFGQQERGLYGTY